MKKIARTVCLVLGQLVQSAWAHEGHNLGSTHWHASDAIGFVIAAAVAVAFYFGKK